MTTTLTLLLLLLLLAATTATRAASVVFTIYGQSATCGAGQSVSIMDPVNVCFDRVGTEAYQGYFLSGDGTTVTYRSMCVRDPTCAVCQDTETHVLGQCVATSATQSRMVRLVAAGTGVRHLGATMSLLLLLLLWTAW